MKKGSITVFAALTIVLVAQLILVLLEGARTIEICRTAKIETESNIASTFGEYHKDLWEKYHLLAKRIDMENALLYRLAAVEEESDFFLNKHLQDLSTTQYTLLTDGEGLVFQNAVCSYMEENILYESAKLIYSEFEAIRSMKDESSYSDGDITSALEALSENTEMTEDYAVIHDVGAENVEEEDGEEESPLDFTANQQSKGILELVLEDTSKVSTSSFEEETHLLDRELGSGVDPVYEELDWYEEILFEQYLITYFSCYTAEVEGHGLQYELEYMLSGKDSDVENLKSVVNDLLWIREAANIAYLIFDEEKQAIAYTLATTLAGFTANPAIIEIVKWGLLAAWAYWESVLDVRALLDGDRIPVIKTDDSWTSDLSLLTSASEGSFAKAKSSNWGFTYKEYLGILVLLKSNKEVSYRAMDLQEKTIGCQMDQLMVQCSGTACYTIEPLFYRALQNTYDCPFSYSYIRKKEE